MIGDLAKLAGADVDGGYCWRSRPEDLAAYVVSLPHCEVAPLPHDFGANGCNWKKRGAIQYEYYYSFLRTEEQSAALFFWRR